MSKPLRSFKESERTGVALQRLRTCNKGEKKSGLGYLTAVEYLKKVGAIK